MLSTAIIIFREIFEIVIILSVVFAAARNITNKNIFIIFGIIGGILSSILLAFVFNRITAAFGDSGQEVINIIILAITILFIAWTVIWMSSHSKILLAKLKKETQEIEIGKRPLYAISAIVATTILREGTEIILFLNSVLISGVSMIEIVKGSFLGLFCGIIIGYITYKGLIKFKPKLIFNLTSVILTFLAATLSSNIANFLASAGIISVLNEPLWNSSWLLREDSLIGKIAHSLFGYTTKPMGLQLLFYLVTILLISLAAYLQTRKK